MNLIKAAEVASRVGMSVFFVYSHAEELGGVRTGTRHIRFDPIAVEEFIRNRRLGSESPKPKSDPKLDFIFRRRA